MQKLWEQILHGLPQNKNDTKLRVSTYRPRARRTPTRSCSLSRATLRCRPLWAPFVSRAPSSPAAPRARTGGRASRALAVDRGCLLLSTPSSTPITRARPRRHPISSLGKSTLPRGPGSDWPRRLSVRRASRKDAAGVLGTRSPERRRSFFEQSGKTAWIGYLIFKIYCVSCNQ